VNFAEVSKYSVLLALLLGSAGSFAESEESLEQRMERVERMLDSRTLIEMNMRLSQLQQEVQQMHGQVELLEHEFTDVKNRQKEIYMDLDRRIGQLQPMPAGAAGLPSPGVAPTTVPALAPTPTQAPTPTVVPAPSRPSATMAPSPTNPSMNNTQTTGSPLGEQEAYDQSFKLLKAKDFKAAVVSFQSFLASYPQSGLAPNAQYWLSECFYVLRQFDSALPEFQKVVSLYPGNSKVPDAQLKIGYIYYESGQWDQVRTVLTELINQYPNSTAARLADLRLTQMQQEGH